MPKLRVCKALAKIHFYTTVKRQLLLLTLKDNFCNLRELGWTSDITSTGFFFIYKEQICIETMSDMRVYNHQSESIPNSKETKN
jgi:hypothetical protein